MKSYVYALTDPDTGAICYVGKSDNPLQRHYGHITTGMREDDLSAKAQWLRGLRAQSKLPGIRVLEEATVETVLQIEKEWIQRLYAEGVALVNDVHIPRPPKPKPEPGELSQFFESPQTEESGEDLLSVSQVATLLGVRTAAVYQAIKSGSLPCTSMLGKIGILKKDVQTYQPRQYRDRPGSKAKGGRPRRVCS